MYLLIDNLFLSEIEEAMLNGIKMATFQKSLKSILEDQFKYNNVILICDNENDEPDDIFLSYNYKSKNITCLGDMKDYVYSKF